MTTNEPEQLEPVEGEPEPPHQSPWTDRRRWILLLVIAVVSVALDQGTKQWANEVLQFEPGRMITVVDGYAAFRYVRNPGAAWGFLSSADASFRLPFFIVVTSLAMVFMLYIFIRLEPDQTLLMVALSLILGGALGNFIDRVRFNEVVDFILLHYQMRLRWPTFNVADIAISVGVGMMLLEMVLGPYLQRRREAALAEEPAARPGPGAEE